jgi:hypothetical protein
VNLRLLLFFLQSFFISTYILVVQEVSLWHLYMCLQCILIRYTPSSLCLFPFLRTILMFNFHTRIQSTLTIFPFPHTLFLLFLLPLKLIPRHFLSFIFLSVNWLFKEVSPWYFTYLYIVLLSD